MYYLKTLCVDIPYDCDIYFEDVFGECGNISIIAESDNFEEVKNKVHETSTLEIEGKDSDDVLLHDYYKVYRKTFHFICDDNHVMWHS